MANTTITPAVGAAAAAGVQGATTQQSFWVGPIKNSGAGGANAILNVNVAQIVKSGPGVLVRVNVVTAGSGGTLVLNDAATLAAAATANAFLTLANSALTAGVILWLDWPCGSGIVVSAIPTGSQLALSFS